MTPAVPPCNTMLTDWQKGAAGQWGCHASDAVIQPMRQAELAHLWNAEWVREARAHTSVEGWFHSLMRQNFKGVLKVPSPPTSMSTSDSTFGTEGITLLDSDVKEPAAVSQAVWG